MDAKLHWAPSPLLYFEINATAAGITYTITRHTLAGTQSKHHAFAGQVELGAFAEGTEGMQAAKRACEAYAAMVAARPSRSPNYARLARTTYLRERPPNPRPTQRAGGR